MKGQNSQLISNDSNPKFKSTKSPNQKIQTKSNSISKDIHRLKIKGWGKKKYQPNGEQK